MATDEFAVKDTEKWQETLKQETRKDSEVEHKTCDNQTCPYCHSDNVYGMSRVVGYFSNINNWNNSKKSEFKRRQQGKYWINDNDIKEWKKKQ